MKFSSKLLGALVLCGAVGTAAAQQLEVNDAGGSLRGAIGTVTATSVTIPVTVNPVVGCPFGYGPSDLIVLRTTGAANAPLILLLGQLAATSLPVTPMMMTTEYFDLDLSGFLYVLADGFGGTGSLPISSHLNPGGVAQFIFPVNATTTFDFAFQAVVADPAEPFGLNFTAANAFTYDPFILDPAAISAVAVVGDDTLGTANLLNPVCVNGTGYTTLKVSTNGFVSFGSAETINDLSDSVGEFTTGNPGSTTVFQGPLLAVAWDDLDMGNRGNQGVAVEELAAGLVRVRWVNADRFSADFLGDFTALIDSTSATTIITLSYDLDPCANIANFTPLIGFSAGNAAAVVTALDLATGGVVNPTAATGGLVSLYEHFTTGGTFDLDGVTLTFADAQGCFGDMFLF